MHRAIRKALAVAFWLHALGATILLSRLFHWHGVSEAQLLQLIILSTILFYAYVANNAGWSILVDVLYVYVSPVIIVGILSWKSVKRLGRSLAAISPAIADLYKLQRTGESKTAPLVTTQEGQPALTRKILKPFFHFSGLWCLLIAISTQRWILIFALIALLAIAASAVRALHSSLSDASSLMEKINLRLRGAVEKFTQDLKDAAPSSKQFKDGITNVRVYGALFRYLKSAEAVRKVTRKFSLAIAIPIYIYTSLLCGFVYYDIAKLAQIKWSLANALIDSLYMPIAFTDLPHNYLIRTLGGLQVASLILIGYDAIFKSINESMEKLSSVANNLSALIETDAVADALRVYESQGGDK